MTAIDETNKTTAENNKAEEVTQKNVREVLHLAICSDLRRDILIFLLEGGKSLGELREKLSVSSTTAIHALRELEKRRLTYQDDVRDYRLTNTGNIITRKIIDLRNAAEILAKYEKFWDERDLSGIPDYLLNKIECLNDATLLTSTSTDILKIYTNFIALVTNSKEIRGISPVFISEFTQLFAELVSQGAKVELIVTGEVLRKILETADLNSLKESIHGNLQLRVLEHNPKVAFSSGEGFISLGLFHVDGTYDFSDDLISYSKEAIAWGRELFEYYLELSEPVVL
jgi:predicted transcriptional regulator